MKLRVLGSSSSGNSYILENEKEILLLEAGIKFSAIKAGIHFDLSKVVGCLVSHEHGDHAVSIPDMMKVGIDVYASKGTFEARGITKGHRANYVQAGKQFKVGGFTILPFEVQHDAVEPLGFLIHHKDIGKLLFITDSYYCKYKFQGVENFLVECNYRAKTLEENIEKGLVPRFIKDRITKSHFEIENVKEFLKSSDLSKTRNIILIHLSSQNSDGEEFKKEIEQTTGVATKVACKGLEMEIGKELF